MKSIKGVYHNGKLTLVEPIDSTKPLKITLIIEGSEDGILSRFSFLESQYFLKDIKTSFSDLVIKEREESR